MIWKYSAENTQKKSQDCVTWTFLSTLYPLQVGSLQNIYPVSSFAVFCCTQSLDQAYSCSRISWLPQFTISQAQGSSQLARLLLRCLQGLSTVLSELTYWWRRSTSGLVYMSYKSSPPENAGNQRTCSFSFTCSIEKVFALIARCLCHDTPSMKQFWSSSYLKQASRLCHWDTKPTFWLWTWPATLWKLEAMKTTSLD